MKKIKILIVDDEEMLLDLFEMIISENIPSEITTTINGKEAVKILEQDSDFHLIISDYNMPQMTGGQLYRYNAIHHNIPFFLFSGSDLDEYPECTDFKESNPNNRFFGKPFDEESLTAEIKRLYDSIP